MSNPENPFQPKPDDQNPQQGQYGQQPQQPYNQQHQQGQNGFPPQQGQFNNGGFPPQNGGFPQQGGFPPQPPKSNKKLIIGLIIGAVAFVLVIGIVIVSVLVNGFFRPDKDYPTGLPSSSATATPDAEEEEDNSTAPQEGPISLEETVDLDGELAAWSIPLLSTDGWTTTAVDENGINAFTNTETGCVLISSQNQSLYNDQDAVDSVKVQEEYMTVFVGSAATNVVSKDINNVELAKDITGNNTSVEFLTSEVTYLGGDGIDYRMTLSVRNFSNIPASTALIYVCPTATYDDFELMDIRDDTAITFFKP